MAVRWHEKGHICCLLRMLRGTLAEISCMWLLHKKRDLMRTFDLCYLNSTAASFMTEAEFGERHGRRRWAGRDAKRLCSCSRRHFGSFTLTEVEKCKFRGRSGRENEGSNKVNLRESDSSSKKTNVKKKHLFLHQAPEFYTQSCFTSRWMMRQLGTDTVENDFVLFPLFSEISL